MNITACITSYNQRGYLIEAIESVLAQTLRPAEIVIIDDASTDDSAALIAGYAARYPDLIRPIRKEHNRGVVDTFNLGLDAARGDYISFLAGDDRWLPAKLEREAGRLTEPDHPDGVFSDYYFTGPGGEQNYLWAGERRPPQGHILPQVLGRDFPRRALFRGELADVRLWREAGHFDPSFKLYEDWDMHIRLAARLRYAYIPEPLSEYRRHGTGLSMASIESHLTATDRIERKYADLLRALEATHGPYLRRQLAGWRAHLWRNAAREVARRRPPGFRAEALRRFRRSLAYEPKPDIRLLWYLLRPAPGA
jgi:glycosyltransferase involved in cell wall biosynthesis